MTQKPYCKCKSQVLYFLNFFQALILKIIKITTGYTANNKAAVQPFENAVYYSII